MTIELELTSESALQKIWEVMYPGSSVASPTEIYEQLKVFIEEKDEEIRLLRRSVREVEEKIEVLVPKHRRRKEKAAG